MQAVAHSTVAYCAPLPDCVPTIVTPSFLAVNAAGYISGQDSPAGYISQPIELQSHLLQRDMHKAILKILYNQ